MKGRKQKLKQDAVHSLSNIFKAQDRINAKLVIYEHVFSSVETNSHEKSPYRC